MAKTVCTYNPNQQARNWNLLSYVPKERIQQIIDSHSDVIRAYAYIYHDKFTQYELDEKAKKDKVDIDSVRKEPHYHIVLRLTRPFKLSTVKNWFTYFDADGNKINTRLKVSEWVTDFEYLTHKNDPLKYQFPKSEVVCNDFSAFRSTRNTDDQISIDIIDDMLSGMPIYDILQRYGNHFAFRINQYKLLFDLIYYGKEFVEIKNKYGLCDKSRSMQDVNHFYTPVEDINSIKNFMEGELKK